MSIAHFKSSLAIAFFAAGGPWLFAVPSPDRWTAPEQALELKNPFADNAAAAVIKGREIYRDRCDECHGAKGKGNGSVAADLSRKPTDLGSTALTRQKDGELFWKITEGRRPMPAYRTKLSEEQRWQLVAFLRTLAPKETQDSNPKGAKPTKRKSNP